MQKHCAMLAKDADKLSADAEKAADYHTNARQGAAGEVVQGSRCSPSHLRTGMGFGFLTGVLRQRSALRRSERWSRAILDSQRAERLSQLRRWATEKSPFYQRFHAGCGSLPLEELPVLSRGQLMESFDELVTDRRLRLVDLREFLDRLEGYRLFRDRCWVARTSGSTGVPGVFL